MGQAPLVFFSYLLVLTSTNLPTAVGVTIPPHPDERCVLEDITFLGGDFFPGTPSNENSLEACSQTCKDLPTCEYAAWTDPNGYFALVTSNNANKCYYKSTIGEDGEFIERSGVYVSTPDCSEYLLYFFFQFLK